MDTIVTGNTAYWTKELLRDAFGDGNLVVCGRDVNDAKSENIKWFRAESSDERFGELFSTYSFERAVYISDFVTYQGERGNEAEQLRDFLKLCIGSDIKQFVYVGSDLVLDREKRGKDIILGTSEELISYYGSKSDIEMKIIYIPFLASGRVKRDFWFKVFNSLEMEGEFTFPCLEDSVGHFIEMSDLADFLYRLFDKWDSADRSVILEANAHTSFKKVSEFITDKYPKARVTYKDNSEHITDIEESDTARKKYAWFAKVDVLDNLDEHYEEYRSLNLVKPDLKEKIRSKLHLKSRSMMLIELVLGAALTEFLVRISTNTVQFRMVDYRLLFVVVMASVYGTNMGILSAVIECLSLIYAYYQNGTNAILLFYDPGNWLPFILLLIAGAVCGYARQKKDEELDIIRKQNESLTDRVDFITQLYNEAMDYKNRYKKDLIGSRDGFGRIFDVVKRLSTTVPERIFAESIPVLEDILDNRFVAIYTINDGNARFARLEVCSGKLGGKLRKSISLDDYGEVLDTIRTGEVWFNRAMEENKPSYVAGIINEGNVSVLVMIYNARFNQTGTYYVNLIKILTGLMENFIVKAWEYEKAITRDIYIEGTNIVNDRYFVDQLTIVHDLAENQRTSFRLFKIESEGRSVSEMDELLSTRVRNNDLIGLGEDGNIYLLAAQADAESQSIILDRFEKLGLKIKVVDGIGV
ncbi:DUF4118 domain-containing protein [Butyrivibrio sp. MC2013]|uniref:DUF4118 domain-containing protein n=1 Tax=Butyrivibrio sp. MC2013 TaxID=1280686 RepID=UPI000429C222|nr:DUF4118 domain-containing protein [Butyrivibrio sp. MC2013]